MLLYNVMSEDRKSSRKSMKRQPSSVALRLAGMAPFLLKVEAVLSKVVAVATPLHAKGMEAYKEFRRALAPYGPDEIIQMLTGVAMMFFGGFFITTIAVYEAIDQGGRESLVKNIKLIHEEVESVREANDFDDQRDDDNDGIADVNQISAEEYSVRKFLVVVRATDPKNLSDAFGNMYTILMAVVATLQVKFARTISLGLSIGHIFSKTATKFIVPPLKELAPKDFHPWIPIIINYICKMIGASIAFSLNRVLSTIHTAIRGARLATDGFTAWAESRDMHYLSDGYADDAFAFLLAGLGIYGQLFVWSKLPFIVKLLLFPATLTEWLLSMLVSLNVSNGTSTANQAAAANPK